MKGNTNDIEKLDRIGENMTFQDSDPLTARFNPNSNIVDVEMEHAIKLLTYQHYAEYALIPVWVLKDYAWSSNSYYMGVIFGTTAVVWAVCLVLFSLYRRDHEDAFVHSVMALWLAGNYIWMSGELTEDQSGLGNPYWGNNTQNTEIALVCFTCALALMTAFFFVLKPLEVLRSDPANAELEIRDDLQPRFPSYFKTLRQYEYLHVFFWVGKDMCWNLLSPIPWSIFFFFTFAVGIDFVFITYSKRLWTNFAHVAAQFFWVLANFAWGCGEQFNAAKDSPIAIGADSSLALNTGRWWCQVILIMAYQPLALFYVWLIYSRIYPPRSYPLALATSDKDKDSGDVKNPVQSSASPIGKSFDRNSGYKSPTLREALSDHRLEGSIGQTSADTMAETGDEEIVTRKRGTSLSPAPVTTPAGESVPADPYAIRPRGGSDAVSVSFHPRVHTPEVERPRGGSDAVMLRPRGGSDAVMMRPRGGSDAVRPRTPVQAPKEDENL